MSGWQRRIAPLALGTLPVLIAADIFGAAMGLVLPTRVHLAAVVVLTPLVFVGGLPHGRRGALALAGAYALAGLLLYFAPLGERKDFMRRAGRVAVGMERAEVHGIMPGEPGNAWPRPDAESWWAEGDATCIVSYGPDGLVRDVDVGADWLLFGTEAAGSVQVHSTP